MKIEKGEDGREYLAMTIKEEDTLSRHCLDILSIHVVPFDVAYVYVTIMKDKIMNGAFTNPEIFDMITANGGVPLWAEQLLGARIVRTSSGIPKMEVSYPEIRPDGRRIQRKRKLCYPIVEPANPDFINDISLADEDSGLVVTPNDAIRSIWTSNLVSYPSRAEIMSLIGRRRSGYLGENS